MFKDRHTQSAGQRAGPIKLLSFYCVDSGRARVRTVN